MTYVFTFDASGCSGCKACQAACKDKNALPVGVLWRRVIEVSGGEWRQVEAAWENSVFAYNLSLACNHCVHPKCAGVCPVDAYSVRPDGIVLLDSTRCMGCGYCAWACPYGAPQYNPGQGVMSKCNFCVDKLDAGLPPTCVAACPLRVLDYAALEGSGLSSQSKDLWLLPAREHPYPLPDTSPTQPRLSVRLHPGMENSLAKTVSNREEIRPLPSAWGTLRTPDLDELPLVGFTLLTQMAVGMAACGLALSPLPWNVLLMIGVLFGVGSLISFLHLGRKRNAWRAVAHLKKSWLSREILLAGLFGLTWLLTVGLLLLKNSGLALAGLTLVGFGLVYSMSRVYRLATAPAWNSWRTPAAFFLSAAILGTLGMNLLAPDTRWLVVAGVALAAEMGMALAAEPKPPGALGWLRVALIAAAIGGVLLVGFVRQPFIFYLAFISFFLAFLAEAVGRSQFYALRKKSSL
jgi:DMSO reductase iron-sulfur subunit